MSTLRFDIAGGSYAVGCGISKSCSGTGFAVALGAGALGGAISGGVGGMGTSMATNMAYGTLGNMASYTATSAAFGDGPTAGGYAGAIVGGLAGGVMPGYEGIDFSDNALADGFANASAEISYNTAKGAVVGAMGGGVGAVAQTGQLGGFGRGFTQGAINGAIGGGAGAVFKIASMGPAYEDWRAEIKAKQAARKLGVDMRYGPVFRRGGLIISGMSVGRNAVSFNGEDSRTAAEEGTHYSQQINQGWTRFYSRGLYEQIVVGRDGSVSDAYNRYGTNEYEANYILTPPDGYEDSHSNWDWDASTYKQYWGY